VPTVSAIEATGARAHFVDIDPRTYLMNTNNLDQALTSKSRCILPVHLYGQCVDMGAVREFADKHSLAVVEDCAQAHGARFGEEQAGNMSDLSAFSFYPTKTLGAYGDGGIIVTSNSEHAASCRRLRFYGMEHQYYALEHGYNSRLDELQAAILRSKLKRLESYIGRRRSIAETYNTLLEGIGIDLPLVSAGNFHTYYLYVCRHERREEILEYMKERGIFLNVSYRWPVHIMPAYQHLGYKDGDLPNTELAAKEIFSLPMYPTLGEKDQIKTCAVLKEALETVND